MGRKDLYEKFGKGMKLTGRKKSGKKNADMGVPAFTGRSFIFAPADNYGVFGVGLEIKR